jgi:hypothetical protein
LHIKRLGGERVPIDSIYNTYSSSKLRIGGLASGLDVDSIIQDLIRAEQMKVDRIKAGEAAG